MIYTGVGVGGTIIDTNVGIRFLRHLSIYGFLSWSGLYGFPLPACLLVFYLLVFFDTFQLTRATPPDHNSHSLKHTHQTSQFNKNPTRWFTQTRRAFSLSLLVFLGGVDSLSILTTPLVLGGKSWLDVDARTIRLVHLCE